MPTAAMAVFAAILSPIIAMWADEGPMKVSPCASTISANPAFSDRNPYPGWIASARVIAAADRIDGMLR